MASRGIRERLLAAVEASREREHELIALADDSPPPEPGLWTAKDHLAHLNEWRLYAARTLDAGRTGTQAPDLGDETDAINARFYENNKDKTSDLVKSEAHSSYDQLEAALAACTDDVLNRPRPHVPDAPLWQVVPGNCHGHLAEHLVFWHLEQGDEEGAEAAQQWVYELVRREFPEPRAVAAATYNLGCFYVRVGREDEALPRFQHAFELDPSLKKIARTDTDLHRIRNHPDLVDLLGS